MVVIKINGGGRNLVRWDPALNWVTINRSKASFFQPIAKSSACGGDLRRPCAADRASGARAFSD